MYVLIFVNWCLNFIDEYPEIAWGIEKSGERHKPLLIARPKVTDHAVKFEILYCGICHSDVHTGKNDWGPCKNFLIYNRIASIPLNTQF